MKNRCEWVNSNNELYVKYHDEEWGKPNFDDQSLFEMLCLEIFQAGLSFETILKKRDAFRKAFDNFDYKKIVKYDDKKINELLANPYIIRNRLKILATINNAKMYLNVIKEYKTFSNYIWHFTNNEIIYEYDKTNSPLSLLITKDMKRIGFKFIGTTIIYSYLQAIGIINSHDENCYLNINNIKINGLEI